MFNLKPFNTYFKNSYSRNVTIQKDPELVHSEHGVFEFSATLLETSKGQSKTLQYKLIAKKLAENVWECVVIST